MRAAFALLVVAAAAALAWWLLGGPAGAPSPLPARDGVEATTAPPAEAPPVEGAPPGAPTLPARPEAPVVPVPRGPTPAVEGKGDLVVVLAPPEGAAAPADVRLDIERIGPRLSSYPLATRQEDGSWRYAGIPTGRYRVWVLSAGWRDASGETAVADGEEARLTVALVPGASARFRVVDWAGEAPPKFTLSVFDARMRPVAASFQTSATRVRVPAGKELGGVPEGLLIGLKPGTYTLRATGEAGDTDEKTFEARLEGEPPAVELKLKKR
jgi:hypothetical protein